MGGAPTQADGWRAPCVHLPWAPPSPTGQACWAGVLRHFGLPQLPQQCPHGLPVERGVGRPHQLRSHSRFRLTCWGDRWLRAGGQRQGWGDPGPPHQLSALTLTDRDAHQSGLCQRGLGGRASPETWEGTGTPGPPHRPLLLWGSSFPSPPPPPGKSVYTCYMPSVNFQCSNGCLGGFCPAPQLLFKGEDFSPPHSIMEIEDLEFQLFGL